MRALADRLWSNPYALLGSTSLFWAGNAVAGRAAVGEISPLLLTFLRWGAVALALAPFVRADFRDAWPSIRPRWPLYAVMASLGLTGFSGLLYAGAKYTTALNLGLLQGAMPVFVFLCAWIAYRTPVTAAQVAGAAMTILGVAVIATAGDLSALLRLDLNRGDLFVLLAAVFYAAYTVAMRSRPAAVSSLVFFLAMTSFAAVAAAPLALAEYAAGGLILPSTLKGWGIAAFIAVFPTLLAQVFLIRGVELIGPGRSGLFLNLVPIFTAILAVAILRERFGWSHAVALALVLGGIALAERRPPPAAAG